MRFRSDPAKIRESIAPVVSPFTADGAPDTEGLRGLIRWQLESGSHGISLGGSTGEPSALIITPYYARPTQAGEFEAARDLHFGLHPVTDVIFTETNPAAAKWVLSQAGLIGSGFVRPPLVPLTEAGQATVLRLLKEGTPVLEGPVAKVAKVAQ
jgi:dihydrodipicolinate synthase/N-acetylneuraminate lyase